MTGRPTGPINPDKHCPTCGASKTYWQRDPRKAIVDLNQCTYIGDCFFVPEEVETFWDDDDAEWARYDICSEGWYCSHCGRSMMGGGIGWFDLDTGEPQFEYCPYCGWRVDKWLTMQKVSTPWREYRWEG